MSKGPNFVIFLTDDQGYGDLSCMGAGDLHTPNLDRMAKEGIRFTSWYSNSPVCSPARASLLTGRYPGNAGVRAILRGNRTATGLPPHVPTIAKVLKDNGYRTFMVGKWHLGVKEICRPHHHGFDHWFGFLAGCIDYYSHIFYWEMNRPGPGVNPVHDLWEDNREIWRNGEYFTELITQKSIEYIRQAAKEKTPFFLYVAYNAPHYPMHAPPKYMERFSRLSWDRQVMAAMLNAMDESVGEIMGELERQELLDNTFVFFSSDNGPSRESRNWLDGTLDPYYGGTTGKLKGHKFSLYEGGIRVPAIMYWPGRISPGQVLDYPFAFMDIFPTFLSASGIDYSNFEIDGINLLPYLLEGKTPPQRDLFWEMGEQLAIRRGKWKLVLNGQLVEDAPVEEEVHLSNLEKDMGERINLKDEYPELVAELKTRVENWYKEIEERWNKEFLNWEKKGNFTHPE